ncbi:MAG TPA: hypothetical protein VFB13_19425 [Reyranella sp.]|nr:hypothetical protein [Reyranella sp.]
MMSKRDKACWAAAPLIALGMFSPVAAFAADGDPKTLLRQATELTRSFLDLDAELVDLGVEGSGGATDGNYSAIVGTTTLDAMGPVGGGAHTLDEYIDIDRVGPRIYLLARLMMDTARSAGQ